MLFVKQDVGSLWMRLVPEKIWVARRCCVSSRMAGHFGRVLCLRRSTPLLIKKFDFYVLDVPMLQQIGLNRISPDVRFIE